MPSPTKAYSDVDIEMNAHPVTGDVLVKSGAMAVVQAVMSLVQIGHYEKPFHPEIGANIRQLLFELADSVTANLLAEEIKTTLANFEPRASIINVIVEATGDGNGFNVTIEFSIVSLPAPVTISFFLERLR